MKIGKLFLGFALSLLFSVASFAQSTSRIQPRVLLGLQGGKNYNNNVLGIQASVEIPVNRFEIDIKDAYSPIEAHTGLGTGTHNSIDGSGILWVNGRIGLTSGAEYARYVTLITKAGVYVYGGPVIRMKFLGMPGRLEFDYEQQIHNGIWNGVETNHAIGGNIKTDVRLGCTKIGCIRMTEDFMAGRVLTQGNPVCDGSYGPATCPRASVMDGGFTAGFALEFPRQKSNELF